MERFSGLNFQPIQLSLSLPLAYFDVSVFEAGDARSQVKGKCRGACCQAVRGMFVRHISLFAEC